MNMPTPTHCPATSGRLTAEDLDERRTRRKTSTRPRHKTLAVAMAAALMASAPWPTKADGGLVFEPELDTQLHHLPEPLGSQLRAMKAELESAPLAIRPVNNCNDSGAGSFRAAVAAANSGDVIDLTGLNCTIELQSSIVTAVESLRIRATPRFKYHIDGNDAFRLVHHGTGTLTLEGVSIGNGRISRTGTTDARGGCIFSSGSVHLTGDARVRKCTASAVSGDALGGAIFALGNVTVDGSSVGKGVVSAGWKAFGGGIYSAGSTVLRSSQIYDCQAHADWTQGGGVFASESLTSKYSTFSSNTASGPDSMGGAGAAGRGPSAIIESTFSSNRASSGGALALGLVANPEDIQISQSTFTGNEAASWGGAAVTTRGHLNLENSTISGNTIRASEGETFGAALMVLNPDVQISSSIVSGNKMKWPDGTEAQADIFGILLLKPGELGDDWNIIGSHNLFGTVRNVLAPPDTLWTNNPGLGPLRSNGGPTSTMAPLPSCPARNRGRANSFEFDQRGPGFPRVVGSVPDIGAVELDDGIFANSFERPL